MESLRAMASNSCLTSLLLTIANYNLRLDLVSRVFLTTTTKRTTYRMFKMNYSINLVNPAKSYPNEHLHAFNIDRNVVGTVCQIDSSHEEGDA